MQLARSRVMPALRGLKSPLFMPSISSKGFPVGEDGIAESSYLARVVAGDLKDVLLISAYDIAHRLLLESDELLAGANPQEYSLPEILVIDSGGYELSDDFESGEVRRGPRVTLPFSFDQFVEVVDSLKEDRPTMVVAYDHPQDERGDYTLQRERAQEFFAARPHLISNFLLKPPPGDRSIKLAKVASEAANLGHFNVIGVTEKDLGESMLDRLVTLGGLRKLLDRNHVTAPIHVFGALDPVMSPLFFMMGGEIFDGLSWMRFAYHEGVSIHPETLSILVEGSLEAHARRRDDFRLITNLQQLQSMKHALTKWHQDDSAFRHIPHRAETLRAVYETAIATLNEGED